MTPRALGRMDLPILVTRAIRHAALSAALLLAAFAAVDADALDVEQWQWGFAGKAIKNHFTPLSVLVSNPSSEPFDGVMTLRKCGPMGASSIGAPVLKRVFLGPFSSKWVQFEPFIRDDNAKWRLHWGRRSKNSMNIPAPPLGGAAAVVLTSGDTIFSRAKVRAPAFRENLFPPSVAATAGLAAMALDHTPEFTPAQTKAFMDWLRGGGKLYILPDASGATPQFTGGLAILNFPGEKMALDAGTAKKLYLDDKPLSAKDMGAAVEIEKDPENNVYIDTPIDTFFHYVRKRVKTNHNWGLIFFISVVYMIFVTVVNYLVGRKTKTPLKPLAFFVATVAVFSLLLAWCGQRGQGEKSQINTLTMAREISPGRFVAQQWIDVFATSGDYYEISYGNGEPAFFSDCREENSLNAEIVNGTNGFIKADIPMFSSVQFYHAGAANAPGAELKSFKQAFDGTKAKFIILELSPDFPAPVKKVVAVALGKFYEFRETTPRKYEAIIPEIPKTFSKRIQEWDNSGGVNALKYGYYDNDEEQTVESLIIPMIIRSRGGDESINGFFPSPRAADDHTDIYILAPMHDSFKSSNDKIKTEKGSAIYHFVR